MLSDNWKLYKLANAIEPAACAVLIAEGLPAFDRRTLPRGEAKPVPRIEVQLKVSGATTHRKPVPVAGAEGVFKMMPDAYTGDLSFQVITQPREAVEAGASDAYDFHAELVAKVRFLASEFVERINDQPTMTNHVVNNLEDQGETPALLSEAGLEYSTLTFGIHFSIRAGAWV